MTPNFDPGPLAVGPPRVVIGAVGPAMLRLAATECDGVLLHPFCTPDYLAQRTQAPHLYLRCGIRRVAHNSPRYPCHQRGGQRAVRAHRPQCYR
jgi:hypothetical protein